jgi:hypothetical protein
MDPATIAGKAVRMLMHGLGRAVHAGSHELVEESVVFAVTNCHPTRVAIYAAAFQGGWKVEFMRSLSDVLEATRSRTPKAVFYEHIGGGTSWDRYCSLLAGKGIPFILLGHKTSDETFLVLLAAGGYHAWGNPLTSEDIVKAVELAEEVAGMARAVP